VTLKNLKLLRNLTLRQLRVFLAAARHLSFSKAAEELNLTAPAVSMQIKEMESDLGVEVFSRTGRRVELTTAGEYFLVYAKRIAVTLREAEITLAKLRGAEPGTLRIGLVSTAKYFLPRMLAEFHREHAGIDIRLAVGNREQLVAMLRANEVDIAIMGRPPKELAVRAEPFAAHPHVFVAPSWASVDPQGPTHRGRPQAAGIAGARAGIGDACSDGEIFCGCAHRPAREDGVSQQ